MAESMQIQIFERDTTITPRKLREIGYIPATIYGKDIEPVSIQLKAHEFELALAHGVRQFTLDGLGKKLDVGVKQIQKRGTKESVLHAEFFVPSKNSSKAQKSQKQEKQVQQPAPAVAEEAPEQEPVPAG